MSVRVTFGATTRIVERHPTPKRIILGLLGLFPPIAPYELWRGLWPPSAFTPLIAVIVLGALMVGGLFIAGAIFGYDQAWTIRDGAIVIRRRAPVFGSRREFRRADVTAADVIRHDWSDGDPSFAVVLVLASGERLEVPHIGSEQGAERIRDEVRRCLGLS
jgi:hypothetical protein